MRWRAAVLAISIVVLSGSDAGALTSEELEGWALSSPPMPSDLELLDQLRDAVELRQRRELTRVLDAREPGELAEDARLTQYALDAGLVGLDALFVFGDDLFELPFRPELGLGNGLGGVAPNLRRVHEGERGGPDAVSCSSCHTLGGLDGAGANTQNAFLRGDGDSTLTADVRNPPHLLGLGPIEALAQEMTRALQGIREEALAEATASGAAIERPLETHGVDFGVLRVSAAGVVDASGVEGVDADLVVRPFGWKGHQATIRAMAAESFRIHMGIVSAADQARVALGELDPAVYGEGGEFDVDGDGVSVEIEDGMLTTMVGYLAQLEIPVIEPPADPVALERFARGSALFEEVGCAGCHRPMLELRDPIIETRPDHPEFADRPAIAINVATDGEHPKIEPRTILRPVYEVPLFSDLRRHDMGPDLATPGNQAGIRPSVFLTRPLWGLAETAPYLHDGRAPTIDDAIRMHGGEAGDARDAYVALGADEQASLRIFLTSLTRIRRVVIP
jgi:mono/diheme cytochrome c family protein